jgi:hypothetical protein
MKHPDAPHQGDGNQAQQKKQRHGTYPIEMQYRYAPSKVNREGSFGKNLIEGHSGKHSRVYREEVGKHHKHQAQKKPKALLPEVGAKNEQSVHESVGKNTQNAQPVRDSATFGPLGKYPTFVAA